jgi:hypothetical protein
MRQRANLEELTQKLNKFRMENVGKAFTSAELIEKLYEVGFNKSYAWGIMTNFPHEKVGSSNLYSITREPIHVNVVKSVFERYRNYRRNPKNKKSVEKEKFSEEEALNLLASRGYQVRKCVGFDLERFSKENPILYKKYLKYEII